MATVTQMSSLDVSSGYTVYFNNVTYQPDDILIGFVLSDDALFGVSDNGFNWSTVQNQYSSGNDRASIIYRQPTNSATNTNVALVITDSISPRWAMGLLFRIRPDYGNTLSLQALNNLEYNGTSPSLTIPGTPTSRSVIIAGQCNNGVQFTFDDTDTTAGAWSAKWGFNASSGADRAIAAQYKQPTGDVAQTYNGTFLVGARTMLLGVNILEVDRGYWGVRL